MIEDLRVLAIGPVETGCDVRSPGMPRVGIHRIIVGPAIVSLPRVVAALKENVRAARIPHDEDDITLPGVSLRVLRQPRETAEINATWPFRWNLDLRSRFPTAFPQ